MVPCFRSPLPPCMYVCVHVCVYTSKLCPLSCSVWMLIEHQTQWSSKWNGADCYLQNVIKPIQPTKTQAHTLSLLSLSPSLARMQANTHTHPSPNPRVKATQCLLLGSDHWSWCAHHVLGLCCSLLWYQWLAISQTSSKRTCQWSSYSAEPRSAASHDPQLSWVRLTYSKPWDDL